MGKIADRFAQKRHPLYPLCVELLDLSSKFSKALDSEDDAYMRDEGVSVEFLDEADDREKKFSDRLRAIFLKLSNTEFCELHDLLCLNAPARGDGEDAIMLLEDYWERMATSHEIEQEEVGLLLAIPLLVTSRKAAWDIDVTDSAGEKITTALKNFDFFGEDAEVNYVPRLLSPAECALLDPHVLFHIQAALRNGNNREAHRLVLQKRVEAGAGLPVPEPKAAEDSSYLSTGVLLTYVKSGQSEAMPLVMHLETILDESEGDTEECLSAEEDAMALLAQSAKGIKEALNLTELHIPLVPRDWFASQRGAAVLDRVGRMVLQLRKAGINQEDDKFLIPHEEIAINEDNCFVIRVRDKRKDKSEWIELMWGILQPETPDQAMGALMHYFNTQILGHKAE